MPTWETHKKRSKTLGVDEELAHQVSYFLDMQSPHKRLHNDQGVLLSALLFGPKGGAVAAQHIVDDFISETIKREIKRALKEL